MTAIVCLLVAVAPLIPDILYIRTPAAELWKRWENVEGKRAELRKMRAATGDLTLAAFDPELKYGIFIGSQGGKYRTTLRRCTCPDFKKRKVVCKHMYYLAAKCGVEKLEEGR